MRSTIPATLLVLGCCFIYSFHSTGCATNNTPDDTLTSGSGTSSGGNGGSGGSGGACIPLEEVCDGKDNDCDSDVDEGCPCIDGQTQLCYSGPDGTQGVGPCSAGQQACDPSGTWGPCVGEIKPKPKELCNFVDDDCNGVPDDLGTTTCGAGACQVTVATCENGKLTTCVPKLATLEVCDGIDNNCNQLVDETFPNKGKACVLPDEMGACVVGKKSCISGQETCVPDVMPTVEACNDIDDDCDGVVDNDVPGTGFDCDTGYAGVCRLGQLACKGGKIDCFPNTSSSPEKCNLLDDDCDGMVDEENPGGGVFCDTGKPDACALGTTQCTSGVLSCNSTMDNEVEVCNGIDDNCNGTVDEGNPGGGVACGCNGIRACINGKIVCQGGPTVFLEEDFSNAANWMLDAEWDIKPPPAMVACGDPTSDTSPGTDNMLAGVNVGGCAATTPLHPYYYLTSPEFNTANAPAVILTFKRWLRSDLAPYMNSVVEVYNGITWYPIYQNGGAVVADTAWTTMTYDLTNYRNANMRIRWGFTVGAQGTAATGSWNIDDVRVMAGHCP